MLIITIHIDILFALYKKRGTLYIKKGYKVSSGGSITQYPKLGGIKYLLMALECMWLTSEGGEGQREGGRGGAFDLEFAAFSMSIASTFPLSLPPPLFPFWLARDHQASRGSCCTLQYWRFFFLSRQRAKRSSKIGSSHTVSASANAVPISPFVITMNKQEMGRFNISPDEDSASSNSNDDFPDYPAKKLSIKGLVFFINMRDVVSLIMHKYCHRNVRCKCAIKRAPVGRLENWSCVSSFSGITIWIQRTRISCWSLLW